METMIYTNEKYTIGQLQGEEHLHELAQFVVEENYKHHAGNFRSNSIEDEIDLVYQEEIQYRKNSRIFVVRNRANELIGSIRVLKWDRRVPLPIQEIFDINPLIAIHAERNCHYWHIGRFAINSFAGISTLTLFKQLMIYAIRPIILDTSEGYMIAETDSKLLKVMNALGIETVQLGHSLNYLASETVPIYSTQHGLMTFYNHYQSLCKSS